MQVPLRAALHLDWVPSQLSGNRYAEVNVTQNALEHGRCGLAIPPHDASSYRALDIASPRARCAAPIGA
jgi:hypothetical protein